MCPLWPFHTIIMYLIVLLPIWFMSCKVMQVSATKWNVKFTPPQLTDISMYDTALIKLTSKVSQDDINYGKVYLKSDNPDVVSIISSPVVLKTVTLDDDLSFSSIFNVSANFLGYANIKAVLEEGSEIRESEQSVQITVVRKDRLIDKAFVISVIVLVSILYINFGCALDWNVMKQVLRRPVGPSIGILCHFFVMPLLSFGLGHLLFKDSTALQLGLFFTGIAPAGGASNMWTVTLGGNLNLSITMTAVSTFFAFLMMPLWVFTLGRVIFAKGNLVVPYSSIGRSAISLVVPLAIGAALQVYCPRFTKLMVKILKPFSALLLIFIITFASITNLYLFKLFTWEIAVAGLGLPLCGYIIGGTIARLCKQVPEDVLAISIETGIQNTGVAIFMLRYSLGQPEADITTVAPVAVAMMTPAPLLLLYFIQRCRNKIYGKTKNSLLPSAQSTDSNQYLPYKNTSTSDQPLTGHI
ncbi:ileal sodium/bile acid cotransporter-like isoform X2 [Lycorma delicatula]